MKRILSLLAVIGVVALLAGCGNKPAPQAQNVNPADVNNPLVNAKRAADKTIDVAYINQALQLYNVQEGRYPKTLDELVPKYVALLPPVPPGYKLNYDADKGEATVVLQ